MTSFMQRHMRHLEGFRVVTQEYQQAPFFQAIAGLLQMLRWILIAFIVFPRQLLPLAFAPERVEALAGAAERNRLLLLGGVFLGVQVMQGLMLQSNAFEIYYLQTRIWSALERQQRGLPLLPSAQELFEALSLAGAPLVPWPS